MRKGIFANKQVCSFSGNEMMMADVRSILYNTFGVAWNKLYTNKKNVTQFAFSSKKDVTAFYHYLYDDATIYLTRKRDRFEELPFIYAQAA